MSPNPTTTFKRLCQALATATGVPLTHDPLSDLAVLHGEAEVTVRGAAGLPKGAPAVPGEPSVRIPVRVRASAAEYSHSGTRAVAVAVVLVLSGDAGLVVLAERGGGLTAWLVDVTSACLEHGVSESWALLSGYYYDHDTFAGDLSRVTHATAGRWRWSPEAEAWAPEP